MYEKLVENFIVEICSERSKMNLPTGKSIVKIVDDTWNLDLLDLVEYGTDNNRRFRFVSVVNESVPKKGW